MPPIPTKPAKPVITDDMHTQALSAATLILRNSGQIGPSDDFSAFSPGFADTMRTQDQARIGRAMHDLVEKSGGDDKRSLRTALVNTVAAYNSRISELAPAQGGPQP